MASGNEEELPQAQEPSSEGRVAQEAEEVFRSFALCRYQQECQEPGAELLQDPEIEQIQRDLTSTESQVGERLAIIGDDIYRRYDIEFRSMLGSLRLTPENAYEHFTKIASSLFESGINWGRVIALLAFGYRMAMHVWQHGVRDFLHRIAGFVRDFMLQRHIARWIAQQGGWRAVRDWELSVCARYLLVFAVLVLGPLVVRRLCTP